MECGCLYSCEKTRFHKYVISGKESGHIRSFAYLVLFVITKGQFGSHGWFYARNYAARGPIKC